MWYDNIYEYILTVKQVWIVCIFILGRAYGGRAGVGRCDSVGLARRRLPYVLWRPWQWRHRRTAGTYTLLLAVLVINGLSKAARQNIYYDTKRFNNL